MKTKTEFLADVFDYEVSKTERWNMLTMAMTKSVRLRPYKEGTYMRGLMRSAVVTVPTGLTAQLCQNDLAMIVAGGPKYGSFRVVKRSESEVIDTQPNNHEFIVTVMLDIGDVHKVIKERSKESKEDPGRTSYVV